MVDATKSRSVSYRESFDELRLTRTLLLEQRPGAHDIRRRELLNLHKFNCVTRWEAILCVAINTKLERLMAVVSIRQTEGYSSVLSDTGTKEYIRFFINWGSAESYQPVGLLDFEVSDFDIQKEHVRLPFHQLITAQFDADRYWESVLNGIQPRVCAVLSWNQVPPKDVTYQPVFGNVVESRIHTESTRDVMTLYGH
jgi:hypothetical protein